MQSDGAVVFQSQSGDDFREHLWRHTSVAADLDTAEVAAVTLQALRERCCPNAFDMRKARTAGPLTPMLLVEGLGLLTRQHKHELVARWYAPFRGTIGVCILTHI
jgi:hypothetical protein